MKKQLFILLFIPFLGCVPLRIAPNIETDQVKLAKKFKRDLPKSYAFIFEDTKEANEFYNFINTKYYREHQDVEYNVPIHIDGTTYYLSFHEREKTTKTLNLIPLVADAKLEADGNSPMMQEFHTSRTGKWYLLLTVYDEDIQDCLNPEYPKRQEVLVHLRKLQKEYLRTHNYLESYLTTN